MVYICHNCKHEVTPEDLKTLPGVKCPFCGGRILYKVRPPVVKRVKSN
ncbi:DNA-directed RNA polymerase subunit P [Candidatus Thorarchaeota archaeon]|nr:MAG: DNA-directed RNA polymerase subunit P [Candidatus Thorarchaeota archaeon]TFG10064.1 MAG: DNA-directed RNA polymerase subunit P [Candidatus Thorarchaeota archaeon]